MIRQGAESRLLESKPKPHDMNSNQKMKAVLVALGEDVTSIAASDNEPYSYLRLSIGLFSMREKSTVGLNLAFSVPIILHKVAKNLEPSTGDGGGASGGWLGVTGDVVQKHSQEYL